MSSVVLVKHKPTSPGRRGLVSIKNKQLHKGAPCKSLVKPLHSKGGRNSAGRITAWQRGGGHKRKYREIDFKRNKDDIEGIVERIEYDPNRSANIALIKYIDGQRRYIIAPNGLEVNSRIQSGTTAPIAVGNSLPLELIPMGTIIHCIELKPGKGAQLCRSAGSSAQLLAKEGNYVTLRLKSGEMRKVFMRCRATVGEVGNSQHNLQKLGKAGRKRWLGKRPKVRGVAQNPVDHPLGGGEGRSSGGRNPCSPWGLPEGTKTRRNKRSGKYIIRRRKGRASGRRGG